MSSGKGEGQREVAGVGMGPGAGVSCDLSGGPSPLTHLGPSPHTWGLGGSWGRWGGSS